MLASYGFRPMGMTRLCAFLLLATATVVAMTAAAVRVSAATVKDVRIGVHADKTRVVCDLDEAAAYRIEWRSENDVWLSVEATAESRTIPGRGSVLSEVRLRPGGNNNAKTYLRLRVKRPVEVREQVLTNPHRIVIDLHPTGPGGALARSAPPVDRSGALARSAHPVDRAEPLPGTEPLPAPEPQLAAPTPPAAAPTPAPATPPPSVAAVEPRPEWVKSAGQVQEPAVTAAAPAPEAPVTAPADAAVTAAAPLAEAAQPAVAPAGEPPRRSLPPAVTTSSRAEPTVLQRVAGYLKNPFALAGLAALVVVTGLVVLSRTRSPRGVRRRQPEPEFKRRTPPATRSTVSVAAEVQAREAGEEVAEVAPSAPPAARPSGAMPTPPPQETPPPPAQPAAPATPASETLTQRIEELEKQMADVLDSKERLERQVVTQNEELRVQRAALARTQRVLRSMPRPEDDAEEPKREPHTEAPKLPAYPTTSSME